MRRSVAALLGTALLLGSASSAQAQAKTAYFFGGAGITMPMGDFGEYAKTGWMGTAGIGYNLTSKAAIGGEFMYGSNSHDGVGGDKTELMGGGGYLTYSVGNPAGKVVPYVVGGLGALNHKYKPGTGGSSESEWKLMFSGGGGLYFPMGTAGLYLEARYLKRGDTGFVPIVAGFTVGI